MCSSTTGGQRSNLTHKRSFDPTHRKKKQLNRATAIELRRGKSLDVGAGHWWELREVRSAENCLGSRRVAYTFELGCFGEVHVKPCFQECTVRVSPVESKFTREGVLSKRASVALRGVNVTALAESGRNRRSAGPIHGSSTTSSQLGPNEN